MAKLLTDNLKAVLERGRYSKDSVDIPNDHKAISEDEQARLMNICAALGVSYEDTGYTFTAAKGKNGDRMIFSPSVSKVAGVATLKWGDAAVPVANLKVQPTIQESEKRMYLEFDLIDTPGIEDIIEISLVLPKESKPSKADLTKALRKGTLGDLLAETFQKSKKLTDLEPGEYLVIGYETYTYQGETKYNIIVTDLNGKRLGVYKANTKIHRKLVSNPTITQDSPATLEVGESTETTAQGFAIVPVNLVTVDDLAIPEFDFA